MTDISKFSNQTKIAMLYSAVAGLILSDIIPTPSDALFISFQRKLRDKWAKGEIDSRTYWRKEVGNYYLLNSSWWLLVGIAIYFTPKLENKIKLGVGMMGLGAVVAVIYRSIVKDEQEKLQQTNATKEVLFKNFKDEQLKNQNK